MSAFFTELSAAISLASGKPFSIKASQDVCGGDISQAFHLSNGAQHVFVKAQPAARRAMFEAEVEGLRELAAAKVIRVPHVICYGVVADQAYLALEYLALDAHGDAVQLGRQLAAQHRLSAPQFGGVCDNWIGATPQPNQRTDQWIDFWRDQRIGFQLRLAAENGYGGKLQQDGETLLTHLDAFFVGYTLVASLLHGDLWGGNHAYLADGTPVIFDPAAYFGDRECDLAMTELFGGFAPAFHAAYREAWPLDAGYAVRKTLYNLYHILNHANLFGGGYAAQAQRMISQLLAQVR